jgi:hypothetical protein
MKKTVFLAAMFSWLSVSGSFGQWTAGHEYQPFLKEGKAWLVQFDKVLIERNSYTNDSCLFYLQGDTTINGQVYMKAYRQFVGDEPTYYAALREADQKVYMIHHANETVELPLYDFNLNKGGGFMSYMGENQISSYLVNYVGNIVIRGNTYWRQIVSDGALTWKIEYINVYESIGCENGPFELAKYCTLLSCYEGETCLYEKGDEIDDFYDELLVEGKTWLVRSYGPAPDCDILYTYTLKGDTVIQGKTCKKLYESHEGIYWGTPDKEEAKYIGALYEFEPEKSVSMTPAGAQYGKRLYDFGLPVGTMVAKRDDGSDFIVLAHDTVEQKGIKYPRQTMGVNENEAFIWVEGVGSETGLLYTGAEGELVGSSQYLISCTWPDGRQYVTEYGKKYLEGIRSIKNEEMNNTIYDLQGRRVENPKQGEIYIQKGKKTRK